MPLLLEGQVGERDVLCGERRARHATVAPRAAEREAVAVRRDRHAFGDQPVDRIGFVQRPRHQTVEAHLHARRRIAVRTKVLSVLKVVTFWLKAQFGARS